MNPLGVEVLETFDQGVAGFALVVILVLCIGASAVSVVVRYRTAVGTERLQLKWLMAAGVVAAAAYALLFFWDESNIQLVWSLIPIAIGLSMHRHHLYDIDRLISRTIATRLWSAPWQWCSPRSSSSFKWCRPSKTIWWSLHRH